MFQFTLVFNCCKSVYCIFKVPALETVCLTVVVTLCVCVSVYVNESICISEI